MRNSYRLMVIGAFASVLAGCASSRAPQQSGDTIPRQPAVILRVNPAAAGAGSLVGRNMQALVSLMGQPALDVREGAARKLQFLGTACVLDAYLYPPRNQGEPVVTHVDARLPDGRDIDRETCAASLRRR